MDELRANHVTRNRVGRDALAVGCAVVGAFLYVFSPLPTWQAIPGIATYDAYAQSLPSFLYARGALQRGWGLLWNDFQNCGQPFFAMIYSALLYPINWLFLFADPTHALLLQAAANLAVGGVGMYLLCRELALSRYAAVAGALAFELGGITVKLAFWSPYMIGPYVWLPLCLWLCERILRRPSPGGAVALGLCLTLQLLAGFPQTQMLTFLLIVLRTMWDFATRHAGFRRRAALYVGAGLVLPELLGAVQLLPALEVAQESIRNRALTTSEASPWEWTPFVLWSLVQKRTPGAGSMFQVATVVLAGFAWQQLRNRPRFAFYCGAGALFFVLSFEPFFSLYRAVPLLNSFRMPDRLLWAVGFCFAVVVAFGADALRRPLQRGRSDWKSLRVPLLAWGVFLLLSGGFTARELAVAAGVLLSAAALRRSIAPRLAAAALLLLLITNLYAFSLPPSQAYTHAASMFRDRRTFDYVARHDNGQHRMYQVESRGDYGVMARSGSVFSIPSIQDYEHQTSARYASFFVRMITGRPLKSLNDFVYAKPQAPQARPLFDLVATRYIVVGANRGDDIRGFGAPLARANRRMKGDAVRLYENSRALPRAFFVPRAEVVEDPDRLLEILTSTAHDPRRVALVEKTPADGFLGAQSAASGEAHVVRSRGEELAIRVTAPAEGFLFVSDQFYPGWEATVNGAAAPISRANYAFRLVRVPRGKSEVVFRYRPMSLRIGAAVSALTLIGLVAWAAVHYRVRN